MKSIVGHALGTDRRLFARGESRSPHLGVGNDRNRSPGQDRRQGRPYGQTRQIIANIEHALDLRARLTAVVRTRISSPTSRNGKRWAGPRRSVRIDPTATTMVEVRRLIDPDMMVEIEVEAIIPYDPPGATWVDAAVERSNRRAPPPDALTASDALVHQEHDRWIGEALALARLPRIGARCLLAPSSCAKVSSSAAEATSYRRQRSDRARRDRRAT